MLFIDRYHFIPFASPSFEVHLHNLILIIDVDNNSFKPFAFHVSDIQSMAHLQRLPSPPLFEHSLAAFIDPLIVLVRPTCEVHLQHRTSFLNSDVNVCNVLTATISALHHLLTLSRQSMCSPIENCSFFTFVIISEGSPLTSS